jgi:hypothetical protein
LGDYDENTYPRSNSLLADVYRSYSIALLRPGRSNFQGNVMANGSAGFHFMGLTLIQEVCVNLLTPLSMHRLIALFAEMLSLLIFGEAEAKTALSS